MKYGLMESFTMHHSDRQYGVVCPDRVALFAKAQALGFDGIEFGLDRDYAQDRLWTGEGELRQAMQREAIDALPLYPEECSTRRPTAEQVLRLFSLTQRHVLRCRPGRAKRGPVVG